MERPDINSKKYIYYHKKLGKKMFNNQKYLEDCKKFSEQNVVLPQADVIKSVCVHFDSCKKQEKYKAHCSVQGIHKCYEQTVL
jgi:hypothetical protein